MGAICSKVNREKAWLRKIFALVKIFFQLVDDKVNATYQRHILTGPGHSVRGCLFSVGVSPARPFFLTLRKAGDTLNFSTPAFFRYSLRRIGQRGDDPSAVTMLKAGPGGLAPYITSPLPVFLME